MDKELKTMNKKFARQYTSTFSTLESMPDRCPFCNRRLNHWFYEKAKEHINKCAKR